LGNLVEDLKAQLQEAKGKVSPIENKEPKSPFSTKSMNGVSLTVPSISKGKFGSLNLHSSKDTDFLKPNKSPIKEKHDSKEVKVFFFFFFLIFIFQKFNCFLKYKVKSWSFKN